MLQWIIIKFPLIGPAIALGKLVECRIYRDNLNISKIGIDVSKGCSHHCLTFSGWSSLNRNCYLPPLYRTINPGALGALVSTQRGGPIDVSFTYEGVSVTVSSRGDIVARPLES